MPYYFVANIRIHDPKEYQLYINEVEQVFSKFKGKYLAVDNDPQLLEGHRDYTRSVIIEFNSKADFDDWYNYDDYQRILKHRLKAAECDTILIKGLDEASD